MKCAMLLWQSVKTKEFGPADLNKVLSGLPKPETVR